MKQGVLILIALCLSIKDGQCFNGPAQGKQLKLTSDKVVGSKYLYDHSSYPRYPFVDHKPKQQVRNGKERYVTVLVTKPVFGRVIDPSTGRKVIRQVSVTYAKRTVRLTYDSKQKCFGYYQGRRFIPFHN